MSAENYLSDAERARIKTAAIEYAHRSRTEQGLPIHVTDPVLLAKVARIFSAPSGRSGVEVRPSTPDRAEQAGAA